MTITTLLNSSCIDLNVSASNKNDVIKKAVKLIVKSGNISNLAVYEKGVFKREEESTTGIGEGIAIPHCKSKVVKKPTLAAMIIKKGVDYQALDGDKVHLLFLIAAPDNKDNVHLDVLARLSNMLMHEEFKNNLLKAKTKKEFLSIIDKAESDFMNNQKKENNKDKKLILAVTACPTGIAHTFMAEEALKKASEKFGYSIKVETNGQGGVKNKLTSKDINSAVGIIAATDVSVEMDRFAGKKLIQVSVSNAIKNPEGLIKKLDSAPVYKSAHGFIKTKEDRNKGSRKFHDIYRHLMSGVSHMLPLVVGGGILIALAFFIDTCCGNAGSSEFGSVNVVAKFFKTVGGFAFNLMLPILAGFIGHSISGRPGLVVGIVGGICATSAGTDTTPGFNLLGWVDQSKSTLAKLSGVSAGFIGAIAAGFLAGYIVKLLEKATCKMPKSMDGLRPILIYPVVGILLIGLAMFLLNVPFMYVSIGFTNALNSIDKTQWLIPICLMLAAMMSTDFGGPINKVAYVFATGLIASHPHDAVAQSIMAAVMLGGMIPPLAVALSIALFPQKYSKEDRKNGPVTGIMGLCFITEGVIPYAIKDAWRVILSTIVGSAVGGALVGLFKCQLPAPHGGLFVFPVMGVTVGYYILALVVGTIISAILLGILKKDVADAELGKFKGIRFNKIKQLIRRK